MALSRATSNSSDELGATIAGLKSRINELETATGVGGAPVGSIIDFIGASAPAGWTLLDGSTIVNGRFLYPSLWSVLPSNFKVGNNILKPDTRGRVTVHQGTSTSTSGAIGSTGGQETVSLVEAELPPHQHSITHGHRYEIREVTGLFSNGTTDLYVRGGSSVASAVGTSRLPLSQDVTTSGNGNGISQGHYNLQPFIIVLKIMKLA